MMSKARFLALRLRHMSPAEALYRLKRIGTTLCLKVVGRKIPVPPLTGEGPRPIALPLICGHVSDEEAVRMICAHHLSRHRDHVSKGDGAEGHSRHPIRRRHGDQADIRDLWEQARLQDVYRLLLFAKRNPSSLRGASAEAAALQMVLAWIGENPFPVGPHYLSAMECGLRIPVFIYTLVSIDGVSGREKQILVNAIYEHAWLISRKVSLYSSLGNHTICEGVGLIFAGALFKGDDEGTEWLRRGIELLDREISRQILDDGGPLEQSSGYHRFVLDLFWLAAGLLEKNRLHDCSGWEHRLMKGEEFLETLGGKTSGTNSIGDGDDGAAVAPGLDPERPPKKRSGRLSPPVSPIEPAKRQFGDGSSRFTARSFSLAGYTIITGPGETRLIFDHGPLGMPPFYNHGHADALSVILSKEGKPLLVDPGTFRYNGVPRWRRYFKGTRAHNTVTIDGLDQAVQETSFIWSSPYTVDGYTMTETPEGMTIKAGHNGYARLKEPVRHTRSILTVRGGFTIIDTFGGVGIHGFELNFHVHPDAEVSEKGGSWIIRNGGAECRVSSPAHGDRMQLFRGLTDPPFGWYSPAYGKKVEAGVLSLKKRGRPGEVSFTTVIAV